MLIARIGNIGLEMLSADNRVAKMSIKYRAMTQPSTLTINDRCEFSGRANRRKSIKNVSGHKTIKRYVMEDFTLTKLYRARQLLRYRTGLSEAVENLWKSYF